MDDSDDIKIGLEVKTAKLPKPVEITEEERSRVKPEFLDICKFRPIIQDSLRENLLIDHINSGLSIAKYAYLVGVTEERFKKWRSRYIHLAQSNKDRVERLKIIRQGVWYIEQCFVDLHKLKCKLETLMLEDYAPSASLRPFEELLDELDKKHKSWAMKFPRDRSSYKPRVAKMYEASEPARKQQIRDGLERRKTIRINKRKNKKRKLKKFKLPKPAPIIPVKFEEVETVEKITPHPPPESRKTKFKWD